MPLDGREISCRDWERQWTTPSSGACSRGVRRIMWQHYLCQTILSSLICIAFFSVVRVAMIWIKTEVGQEAVGRHVRKTHNKEHHISVSIKLKVSSARTLECVSALECSMLHLVLSEDSQLNLVIYVVRFRVSAFISSPHSPSWPVFFLTFYFL